MIQNQLTRGHEYVAHLENSALARRMWFQWECFWTCGP